jgi:hypothetical protein
MDPVTRTAVGFTTYLRVFEPLTALPAGERERWGDWVARRREHGRLPGLDEVVRAEHQGALQMAVAPRLSVGEDEAIVIDVDGLPYICPLDTQRRIWESLASWRETLAPQWMASFVPDDVMTAALEAFDRTRGVAPTPTRVRTATWHVPLAWFLLVDPSERELVLGNGLQDPTRAARWTATMAQARRRAAQSLKLLQETIPDAPTVDALEDIARWLEEFHPYARVQLDYGDLVTQLDDEFLTGDTSIADLAEGLEALGRADGRGAAQAYERVVRRWRPVQARESSS